MTKRGAQIKNVWQIVYDLFMGPGRNRTYDSFLHMHQRFDQDLLNDITELKNIKETDEFKKKVEQIRAKAGVAQATGFFGEEDLERLNLELDKLI